MLKKFLREKLPHCQMQATAVIWAVPIGGGGVQHRNFGGEHRNLRGQLSLSCPMMATALNTYIYTALNFKILYIYIYIYCVYTV